MNSIFNIKRLGFLLSDHISNKKNQYLLFASIIFSLFLLSIFVHLFWRQDLGIKILVVGSSLAIILAPFAFHFKKTKSTYMLPASVFEKFLTEWIANIIFIPLVVASIGFICIQIGNLLLADYVPSSEITTNPDMFNVWLRLAGIQSVVILGQSLFRKYVLAKTMLTGILLFTLLIVCLKAVEYFDNEPFDIESNSIHIVILKFMFIVSMWTVSYFSLKKTQL